jgi:hypothetical protein
MIYITKKKIFGVLRNLDSKSIKDPVKSHFKRKYFFLSEKNIDNITTYYLFLKDPEKFIENNFVKWKDTKSFVYESNPAFHKDPDCKFLLSKFENMYIPWKFRERKLENALRNWAFDNKSLFHINKLAFIEECINFFNEKYPDMALKESDFEQISLNNSGIENFENYTLSELKDTVQETLKEARDYFEESKKRKVLAHFKEKVFLYHTEAPLRYNDTGINDEQVKEILQEIDENYIKPINEIIIQICIKEFLENKEFDKTILEVLNFKNCKGCYSDYNKDANSTVHFIERKME